MKVVDGPNVIELAFVADGCREGATATFTLQITDVPAAFATCEDKVQ